MLMWSAVAGGFDDGAIRTFAPPEQVVPPPPALMVTHDECVGGPAWGVLSLSGVVEMTSLPPFFPFHARIGPFPNNNGSYPRRRRERLAGEALDRKDCVSVGRLSKEEIMIACR